MQIHAQGDNEEMSDKAEEILFFIFEQDEYDEQDYLLEERLSSDPCMREAALAEKAAQAANNTNLSAATSPNVYPFGFSAANDPFSGLSAASNSAAAAQTNPA